MSTFLSISLYLLWSLVFVGLSIFTAGSDRVYEGAVVFYLILVCLICFFLIVELTSTRRKKKKILSECVNTKKQFRVAILFLSIFFVFYICKFALLGIPILSNSANVERVLFLNKIKEISDIIRFCALVAIMYLSNNKCHKTCILSVIGYMSIAFCTGFRSEVLLPFVSIIIVHVLNGNLFRPRAISISLIVLSLTFVLLVELTRIRFDDFNHYEAAFRLLHRIFMLNLGNVEISLRIVEGHHYIHPWIRDLLSLLSDEPGFSGWLTRLTGVSTFATFQMTPTIIAEGLYAHGTSFGLYYAPVICFIIFMIIQLRSRYHLSDLRYYSVTLFLVYFIICHNQGVGTFIAIYLPRLMITHLCILLFITIKTSSIVR